MILYHSQSLTYKTLEVGEMHTKEQQMATHYPYKVAPSQEQYLRHPDKKVPLPQHCISHRHRLKMWYTKCGWLKYKFNLWSVKILSSRFWIKGQSETVLKRILCEIEENEKASSCQELNTGHPTCAPRALPLSYNSQTTTNPHNPLYVLHRWCWNASVAHLVAT